MNFPLLQIGDSALPIGGYTHSWGLETALARRQIQDSATLETWTRNWLRYSLAPFEGVIVAAACRLAQRSDLPDIQRLNNQMQVMIAAPSIRAASVEMGEQLLWLSTTWKWSAAAIAELIGTASHRGWHHAVVFGILGAIADAPAIETLGVYLHQAVIGMIGAGVRAVPINHTHGQQILAYLHPDVETLSREMCEREPERAGSGCPFYEILCDEQTRLYTRLFRS